MKRIIKIEPITSTKFHKIQRVAAYARVSTTEERQHMSFVAQVDYYKKLIAAHPGWVFVGIYADHGISGTSYHNRTQFKQMLADCEAGKIDRIISKSISRFARNTVDTIEVIRHLKELGIGVEFEKEHIWTLDGKGEFVLTLMASFAQEESRSISENVKWGIRKRMADGKYWVSYSSFLGYGRGFVIEEEGAYIVRLIYRLFLQGLSSYTIARLLTENGFHTARGGVHWDRSTVTSILRNEKYKGDALTQKYYIRSFLEKVPVRNKGQVDQHYITSNHEAIIDPVLFDYVQEEISRRGNDIDGRYSGNSYISNKFYCGECGRIYGLKPIHSNDKYRHNILQCRNRFRKGNPCHNRHFQESDVDKVINETFRVVGRRYNTVEMCLSILEKTVEADRMGRIKDYVENIDKMATVADEGEWALLVDRVEVYRGRLEVSLFGGERVRVEM